MNFAKQFRIVVLENNVGVLMVVDLLRDCALIYIKVTRVSIWNRDTMFIMQINSFHCCHCLLRFNSRDTDVSFTGGSFILFLSDSK